MRKEKLMPRREFLSPHLPRPGRRLPLLEPTTLRVDPAYKLALKDLCEEMKQYYDLQQVSLFAAIIFLSRGNSATSQRWCNRLDELCLHYLDLELTEQVASSGASPSTDDAILTPQ